MLYLIDSSAKNLSGHNLEYLERISKNIKSEFLILGNMELTTNVNPKYRPTFEFSTWDFGRFGFARKNRNERPSQNSKTLRPTIGLMLAEKYIEKFAAFLAKYSRSFVSIVSGFSKQSRCFRRDLSKGLREVNPESTILVSTANARELIGLSRWIIESEPNRYSISVILRRPIVDLRSFIELPLIFVDALVYISAIRKLANKVKFCADTPGLAARISERSGKKIKYVAAMGFELQTKKSNPRLDVAIAPNSRRETRHGAQGLHSISDLRLQAKVDLDSKKYRELLLTTRSIVLPYDPLRYRSRSSGVFAEALTLGILPIVPTGTSMSREITFLNSKILPSPEFIFELKAGKRIDLSQFGQEDLLITFKANNLCALVLEIFDSTFGIRKSAHDFFETNSADSFLIRPSQRTLMSFHSDQTFPVQNNSLTIIVHNLEDRLFGAPYLEGDLHSVLSLTKKISFCRDGDFTIREHAPASIRRVLGI